MNYSIIMHAFEIGHFRGGGGGTCYSPPRRIAPKPSVSGIVHGVGMTPVRMHQAMVWAKAAHHHGASGITFSFATGVIFLTQKVS
jgi:hypothetical protein